MGHDWVFELLRDLADYADRNGLPRLARKAAEALDVARDEVGKPSGEGPGSGPGSGPASGSGGDRGALH